MTNTAEQLQEDQLEAQLVAVLKKRAAGWGDPQYSPALWIVDAMKEAFALGKQSTDDVQPDFYYWKLNDGGHFVMPGNVSGEEAFYSEPMQYKEFHKLYKHPKQQLCEADVWAAVEYARPVMEAYAGPTRLADFNAVVNKLKGGE